MLQKASGNEISIEFDSLNTFGLSNHVLDSNEEELLKALEAPSSPSDLYNTSGGVLTKQSLEKTVANQSLSIDEAMDFIDLILKVGKKDLANVEGVKQYFKEKNKADTGDKIISLINKYFTGVKK